MPNEESVRETDKVLVIVTSPEISRVYAALLLVQGALLAGKPTDVMFAASGIAAITTNSMDDLALALADEPGHRIPDEVNVAANAREVATHLIREGMTGFGMPQVANFLQRICKAGGFVYASEEAVKKFDLGPEDLWEGVKAILPVGAYYKHANKHTQVIFL